MLGARPESDTTCEKSTVPTLLSDPYALVFPYCICESADLLVCQVMRAVEVLTDAVSVLEMASASAGVGGVDVAVSVSVVGGVVVVVVVEVPVPVVGCSGSGSSVASVVKVSSPVMAALPPESMTTTR